MFQSTTFMFQAFDNPGPGRPLERAQWMALQARAPLGLLESALHDEVHRPARWLRTPETGLMMVQGRAGGTGERFNLGEVTVTRCALRVAQPGIADAEATVGVAYVLGRSHRQVHLAALADALLQDPARHEALAGQVLTPLNAALAARRTAERREAAASKVEFFTMVRGE